MEILKKSTSLNLLDQKKGGNNTKYKIGNNKWELNIETENGFFLILRNYFEDFFANKLENLNKRDSFPRQIQITKNE